MKREAGALADGPFDLLVVGGGIYGAWSACHGARQGLRTLLVEREDWGAGTSSASSKLLHGGLRYLAQLRLGLVRRSLRERGRLHAIAPHLTTPLRFVVPLEKGGPFGRRLLGIGLALYDLLGRCDPNARGREWIPRHALPVRCPDLGSASSLGAWAYDDALTDDARLTLAVVRGALAAGARAVNHAPARALLRAGGRVCGAVVEDAESGRTFEVEASAVLDATGPWSEASGWRAGAHSEAVAREPEAGGVRGLRHTKGVHLALPALPTPDARLLLRADDGRVVFLIPWYGRTLLGTTDTDCAASPEELRIEQTDVDYLLATASSALGDRAWRSSDVIAGYCGLRTFPAAPGLAPSQLGREWSLRQTEPGLWCSVGGKLTSARADARRLLPALAREGLPVRAPARSDLPLPGSPAGEDFDHWLGEAIARGERAGLTASASLTLARRHGTDVDELLAWVQSEPELGAAIHDELPFVRAEVVRAARCEMAIHLADIVRRRIPLTILARPDAAVLDDVAHVAARELGWSEERRAAEVAAVAQSWWQPDDLRTIAVHGSDSGSTRPGAAR